MSRRAPSAQEGVLPAKRAKTSSLHTAIAQGDVSILQRLLAETGTDPNARNDDGLTPLHCLVVTNESDIHPRHIPEEEMGEHGEVVLRVGADDDDGDGDGDGDDNDDDDHRKGNGQRCVILRLLVSHHADLEATDLEGQTALHRCAWGEDDDLAEVLLELGARVDARDTRNRTPLHTACTTGYASLVQMLLDHGATLDPVDLDGNTPLHISAERGDVDVVKILIGKGVCIPVRNKQGKTPLDMATDEETHTALIVAKGDLDPDVGEAYTLLKRVKATLTGKFKQEKSAEESGSDTLDSPPSTE